MKPPICVNPKHKEKEMTVNVEKKIFECSICGNTITFKEFKKNIELGDKFEN